MGGLLASDGAFALGEMGQHTSNAGRIYFPSGTPDLDDIRGAALDIEGSVARGRLQTRHQPVACLRRRRRRQHAFGERRHGAAAQELRHQRIGDRSRLGKLIAAHRHLGDEGDMGIGRAAGAQEHLVALEGRPQRLRVMIAERGESFQMDATELERALFRRGGCERNPIETHLGLGQLAGPQQREGLGQTQSRRFIAALRVGNECLFEIVERPADMPGMRWIAERRQHAVGRLAGLDSRLM